MTEDLRIGWTCSVADLEGIRLLQQQNLKHLLPREEALREGFTTAVYTLEFLQEMHWVHPSVVARSDGRVVGYALVTFPELRHGHPLLEDLFGKLDAVRFRGGLLRDASYVVVGQLCVGKGYRGRGLVQAMYGFFREGLWDRFEYCACDVDRENPRSLKAHIRTGFEVVDTLEYGGALWDVMVWDWRGLKQPQV
jgi:hypothetical protein